MSVGNIKEFDMSEGNWRAYGDRMEMYFKANAIKEELKLPILIASMGDAAYELLSDLASPKKPSALEYELVMEMMLNHLDPKPSLLAERGVRFTLLNPTAATAGEGFYSCESSPRVASTRPGGGPSPVPDQGVRAACGPFSTLSCHPVKFFLYHLLSDLFLNVLSARESTVISTNLRAGCSPEFQPWRPASHRNLFKKSQYKTSNKKYIVSSSLTIAHIPRPTAV
ncbi:Uncharacterized protein OBRU01_25060 [Operophtera brumata]|uniref:Uncharacterized protein n=1 Tax=Operophtera brumata TaxID=104452 RepID=A0A0L7KEK8_OPEBR|nr:Uncharacterized protein OBRU01_25060 [Operophtera brumata]